MLNRLLASVAILSVLVAVGVGVLWWRAGHGQADTFHLGAASGHQTVVFTGPAGLFVQIQQKAADGSIGDYVKRVEFRSALGVCLFAPALWGAVQVRRRLLPRRPGWELPR